MSTLPLPLARVAPARLVSLVALASLAMAVDIGVTRITYGVALAAIRRDLDLSFSVSGTLASIHLAGYLVGSVIVPRLARRHRLLLLCVVAHLALAAGLVASALAHDTVTLGVARLLMGVAAGVGVSAAVAMTLDATPVAHRGSVSAAVWAGIGLAIVASGASVVALLDANGGWRMAHLVGAGLAVMVGAGFAWLGQPAAAHLATPASPVRKPAASRTKRSWLRLMASYFAFGAAYLSYSTFAGTELAALGATHALLATFWIVLGLALIAGAAACVLVIRHGQWKDHALWMALLAGAAGAAITLVPGTAALVLSAFVVGLGLASAPAMTTAAIRERSTDAEYLRRFSIATAWLALGQVAGPAIAGMLADHLGPGSASLFAACAYAAAAFLAYADARAVVAFDQH